MKVTLITIAAGALAAATLFAQATTKPISTAAGLGKQEPESNEEVNTRAYIELLRTDLRNSKSQIISEVLRLDAGQASRFWPIYKEFETEYATLGDQILALVKKYVEHYDSLTDAVAGQLGSEVLSIEQQRNALKKKYYDRMKEALGGITAARFLHAENQLERIVDLQIAAQLPVIRQP